jgi:acyl-CoA thioester hydrolase
MPSITIKRRIRWSDADAAGILYYARIFDYFQEGEAELMRSVGWQHRPETGLGIPRRHLEVTYHRVLPLDAPFWLRASVAKLGTTSIRYLYEAFADEACEQLAAEGTITVVFTIDNKPIPIPPELRAKLSE